MTIDRVVMTKEEAAWFSRNIPKMLNILEASERKNKGVTERQTYKTLLSMKESAQDVAEILKTVSEHPFEIELNFSKKQKGIVSSLLKTVITNLDDRIIPTYKEKLGSADGIDYDSYLSKAQQKSVMLKSMKRKFK